MELDWGGKELPRYDAVNWSQHNSSQLWELIMMMMMMMLSRKLNQSGLEMSAGWLVSSKLD